jgi:hypothetical protein
MGCNPRRSQHGNSIDQRTKRRPYRRQPHNAFTGRSQVGDVPSLPPGAKLAVIEGPLNEAVPFTFRLQLPANYQIPAHWHAAVERVTVISGTLNMGVGDKLERSKTKPLGPGSMAIMQPKTNHFVWTKEETVVQLNGTGPWTITYVNPAEDPRKN